jgi:hypothetical protein
VRGDTAVCWRPGSGASSCVVSFELYATAHCADGSCYCARMLRRGPRWEKDPVTSFSEWCEGGEEDRPSADEKDGEVCMAPAV